jgi:hypothetical protein
MIRKLKSFESRFNPNKTLFVGVDNGLSGGIVFLNHTGKIVFKLPMPVESDGKRRKVDPITLNEVFLKEPYQCSVVVERPAGSKSVIAAVSMADSFAKIETVLALNDIRRAFITAKTWQKEFWTVPKMPTGRKFDTKAAALLAATRLWPKENWLATPRSRVPHDGMIDAALIAEYARRNDL